MKSGVFIDFECRKHRPPTLLGVLRAGSRHFHQYILDSALVTAGVARPNAQYATLGSAADALVAENADEPIVGWSLFDHNKILNSADVQETTKAIIRVRYVNAIKLAKRWRRTYLPQWKTAAPSGHQDRARGLDQGSATAVPNRACWSSRAAKRRHLRSADGLDSLLLSLAVGMSPRDCCRAGRFPRSLCSLRRRCVLRCGSCPARMAGEARQDRTSREPKAVSDVRDRDRSAPPALPLRTAGRGSGRPADPTGQPTGTPRCGRHRSRPPLPSPRS